MPEPGSSVEQDALPVLRAPADGLPAVISTHDALRAAERALAAGEGPVAVDTERAQGFRYGSEAYLVQLRRRGSGTHLVDPVPFTPTSGAAQFPELNRALGDAEWIIHAASQDLPCLRLAGLYPTRLFDTELAGRLLGHERVGLGAMVERYFGLRLLKEHSAANWSIRPIPTDWLTYAALDVELLVELRDHLTSDLEAAGKGAWAQQEFAHVLATFAQPAPPREDPWRRTSGINAVKSPLGMAVVRELWTARDEVARRLDLAPGKVLPDRAIAELAAPLRKGDSLPERGNLRAVEGFRRRQAQRHESTWVSALDRVRHLSTSHYPPLRLRRDDASSSPRSWERNHPEAWARWNRVRPAVNQLAESLQLPAENLLSPDALRRITLTPPAVTTTESVSEALAGLGVRPWQRELVTGVLVAAFREDAATGT